MKVKLPTGELIWAQVADSDSDDNGPRDVTLTDDLVHDIDGLLETIHGVANSVRRAAARARPDTVSVEFGVTLSAKTGRVISVLAEAGGSANLKVTLGWGTPVPEHPGPGPQLGPDDST